MAMAGVGGCALLLLTREGRAVACGEEVDGAARLFRPRSRATQTRCGDGLTSVCQGAALATRPRAEALAVHAAVAGACLRAWWLRDGEHRVVEEVRLSETPQRLGGRGRETRPAELPADVRRLARRSALDRRRTCVRSACRAGGRRAETGRLPHSQAIARGPGDSRAAAPLTAAVRTRSTGRR